MYNGVGIDVVPLTTCANVGVGIVVTGVEYLSDTFVILGTVTSVRAGLYWTGFPRGCSLPVLYLIFAALASIAR